MKWFQHWTDSHTNGKIRMITRKHGLTGYALCYICRELVGKDGENYRIKSEKEWKETLKEVTGLPDKELEDMLSYQAEINAIDRKSFERGDLYIPKMKEYSDDYTKRVRRLSALSPTDVVIDKIRIDKIRIEYNNIKGYDLKNYSSEDFGRTARAIKNLLLKAGGVDELVLKAIHWMSEQGYEWTLETIERKWVDFMKYKETPEILKKYAKK